MAHFKPKFGAPAVIGSSRDLGREGYRGCQKAWTDNGIFVFSETRKGQPESTKEAGPGVGLNRRERVENKWQKTVHEFDGGGTFACIYCVMVKEGHDRLMERLNGEKTSGN